MLEMHRPPAPDAALTDTLARAAAAIGRLDQALAAHPLRPAFLFRARLDSVRHQAAIDGQAIDPWHPAAWIPDFLAALADEAGNALQLLFDLERAWFAARRAVAGRRRTSRAAAAIDLLAATPLLSATSLAAGLGMAVKNAAALLEDF